MENDGSRGGILKVPFNDQQRRYLRYRERVEENVLKALRSGWWLNGGAVRDFARSFAEFLGTSHCVAVANGTDALELAMRALAVVAPGRNEIITVANAGGYSSAAAKAAGLKPVYADIAKASQLLSIPSAIDLLTSKTLAVVATHLFGSVVDVHLLRAQLDARGHPDVAIIEDCAQAHGATLGSARAGSIGTIGTFSFYPTKNLGAVGDAGAVVTSSDQLASIVSSLQQYGWNSKYRVALPGGRNSRMDELQAAALIALLPHLDEMNEARAEILERYRAAAVPSIRFVERRPGSVLHLAVVLTDQRDRLREFLKDCNIETEVHYPVLDCFQAGWLDGEASPAEGLPESVRGVQQVLSLPCFVGMTDSEIDVVADALARFPAE